MSVLTAQLQVRVNELGSHGRDLCMVSGGASYNPGDLIGLMLVGARN